jgi:LPXTG-motif cell wall-anchored protein
MPSKCKTLILIVLICLVCPLAEAKLFRNAYVQFELPDQWDCVIEGTEWVCSSKNKIDAKESIIILTAKEVGPQDSFQGYETYLKTPKPVQQASGKTTLSQVKYVNNRKINDHPWIDSLHLGSEISGYYTRYLATIKDKIAILVTLSAHQKYYTKYSSDYYKAVESLRVVASKDLSNQRVLAPVKPGTENLGVGGANVPGVEDIPAPDTGSDGKVDAATLGGIFLLVAALAFYILRRKKRQ